MGNFSNIAKGNYDIVIVGAGPGGSVCARECAKYGLKVLVVDKRQEIGAPVRCGEGLGEVWMKKAEIEFDSTWCVWKSNGAIIYSPKGRKIEVLTKNKGYVIERKMFEKKLAAEAIRKGAKYLIKSRVYDVLKKDGFVVGVKAETPEGNFDIHSKMVIAIDGVDSKTAKYAGINTANPLTEVDSGYEYEMAGLKMDRPDLIHLFVGTEMAPRGYIWIFPKGRDTANVGIGIAGNSDKTAKEYLDKFLEAHPEIFADASAYEVKGGCVPVGMPLQKPYANGLILVGDAAHMVNPIHGGGMGTSMEAAMIAAKIAKEAVDKNDFTEAMFKKYADLWFEQRGNQLRDVLKVRKFFERLNDGDMEILSDFFTPETLLEFSDGKKLAVFMKLFAKHPKLAVVAATTLR